MGATLTAALANNLDKRFNAVFLADWDKAIAGDLNALNEVCRIDDMPGETDVRFGEYVTGVATAPEVVEGAAINYYAMQQGKSVTHTFNTYGIGFNITRKMRRRDKFDLIKDIAPALAGIVSNTIQTDVYAMFNNAFTTALDYDSATLCATAHTLAGDPVGSGANRPGADVDLTESTAESLITLMIKTVGEDGQYVKDMPTRLVAAADNWATAARVTESMVTTRQGTGESGNAINAVQRKYGISVHTSPYLTDTNAWFFLGKKSPIRLVFEERPSLVGFWEEMSTGNWKKHVWVSWVTGADNWRGVVGTSGA
uniref:Putative structural protein n=1 Tax=viral metagenome TaxID=1070528 RepID=A0A6M3IDR6_9ZZZZ